MTSLRLVNSICSRRAVGFMTAHRFYTALTPILRLIQYYVQLPSETMKDYTSSHLIFVYYRMLEDLFPYWLRSLLSFITSSATSIKSNDRCTMISKPLKTYLIDLLRTLRNLCKSKQIAVGSRRHIILLSPEIAILRSRNG